MNGETCLSCEGIERYLGEEEERVHALRGVSHIPIRLRGLLYTNYFLVTWDWRHYLFATCLAVVAVFIASYVPARRAAELPPVVTIRGSR